MVPVFRHPSAAVLEMSKLWINTEFMSYRVDESQAWLFGQLDKLTQTFKQMCELKDWFGFLKWEVKFQSYGLLVWVFMDSIFFFSCRVIDKGYFEIC